MYIVYIYVMDSGEDRGPQKASFDSRSRSMLHRTWILHKIKIQFKSHQTV